MNIKKHIYISLTTALVMMTSTSTQALGWFGMTVDGVICEGNPQSHGPYDYLEIISSKNNALIENARLWEVDRIHYGRASERLSDGFNAININLAWGDYDYTLRAFPNHVLALRDVIELEIKRLKTNRRTGQHFPSFVTPPECYLQRAEKFRPNQEHIPLLYGIYLYRIEKYKQAEIQYKRAISINPENAESHYNLGLLLVRMNRLNEALEQAKKAYALKYPLNSLKQQLISAGVWKTPVETSTEKNK